MQTSIRVDITTRDQLAQVAADEFRGASLDETIRRMLFEHATLAAWARLEGEELADYVDEANGLARPDTPVIE